MERVEAACRARGIPFGVWNSVPTPAKVDNLPAGTQFYIMQAEVDEPLIETAVALRYNYPNMRAAIVTNFGGLSQQECVALQGQKFDCIPECWPSENPMATVENQNWEAYWRGWHRPQPMCGISGEFHMNYWKDYVTPGWSVFVSKYLTDEDWNICRELNSR